MLLVDENEVLTLNPDTAGLYTKIRGIFEKVDATADYLGISANSFRDLSNINNRIWQREILEDFAPEELLIASAISNTEIEIGGNIIEIPAGDLMLVFNELLRVWAEPGVSIEQLAESTEWGSRASSGELRGRATTALVQLAAVFEASGATAVFNLESEEVVFDDRLFVCDLRQSTLEQVLMLAQKPSRIDVPTTPGQVLRSKGSFLHGDPIASEILALITSPTDFDLERIANTAREHGVGHAYRALKSLTYAEGYPSSTVLVDRLGECSRKLESIAKQQGYFQQAAS